MKKVVILSILAAAGMAAAPSWATLIEQSLWHMGEAGSTAADPTYGDIVPLDSVNTDGEFNNMNHAFYNTFVTGGAAPGSTAYMSLAGTPPISGSWIQGGLTQDLQADNYGIEIWARAGSLTDINASRYIMTLDGGTAATQVFEFGIRDNQINSGDSTLYWYGARSNAAYIGATPGADAATIFTPNTWVDLALVRSGGVNYFYVNGVQIGSGDTGTPTNDGQGTVHFGLNAFSGSGGNNLAGDLDEARYFTFSPGTFDPSKDLYSAIPEPATFSLMGLFGAVAFARRRLAARK